MSEMTLEKACEILNGHNYRAFAWEPDGHHELAFGSRDGYLRGALTPFEAVAVAQRLEREAAKTTGGPSREWLERAGDAEDEVPGGPSVGGLAADLGLCKADAAKPVAGDDDIQAVPCGVCGWPDTRIAQLGSYGLNRFRVECNCGASGRWRTLKGPAVAAWNRMWARRDDSRLRDEAAAVLAGLDEIDEMAESAHGDPAWWALEDIFRRCRDRLRAALAEGES